MVWPGFVPATRTDTQQKACTRCSISCRPLLPIRALYAASPHPVIPGLLSHLILLSFLVIVGRIVGQRAGGQLRVGLDRWGRGLGLILHHMLRRSRAALAQVL